MTLQNPNHERKAPSLSRLRSLFYSYNNGRIRLFFSNVPVKLIAACVSGLGIFLISPLLAAAGMFLWLAWL
jgi:hypothetical protein